MGEVSNKVTQKNTEREFIETFTNSAEFGIVSQNDFFDRQISNYKNIDSYYVVSPDDFIYNPRISNYAPVGPIKRNKLNRTGIMSPLYYVFKTKSIDNLFLEKYFESNYWHKFMKLNGDSGARSDRFAIRDSIFKEMPIPLPTKDEQKVIGKLLESLDNTIALHQRELDLLKQSKKGFLEKLFPKDKENVPEIRLSNFKDKWKKRKLAEVSPLRGGFAFKSSGFRKEGIPVVRIANILSSGTVGGEYAYYDEQAIDDGFILPVNAAIIAMSGATTGKVAVLNNPKYNKYYQNQRVGYFRDLGIIDYDYISVFVRSSLFTKQLQAVLVAGAQPNISSKEIDSFIFYFPTYKQEQEKIGNFFRELDNTITLQEQKIESLQQMKKSFLQKMFI